MRTRHLIHLLAQTQIGDYRNRLSSACSFVDKYIEWLQVPVYDLLLVQVLHALAYLSEELEHELLRHLRPLASELFNQVFHVAAHAIVAYDAQTLLMLETLLIVQYVLVIELAEYLYLRLCLPSAVLVL